jgi:hypothetical protein
VITFSTLRVKLTRITKAIVATRKTPTSINQLVINGLVIGYLYAIALSASGIAVCEIKKPGECSEAWSQGYATSSGLVTTFLAYLIPPSERTSSRTQKETDDASA